MTSYAFLIMVIRTNLIDKPSSSRSQGVVFLALAGVGGFLSATGANILAWSSLGLGFRV